MVVYEISIDHETLERMGVEIAFAMGEAENLIEERAELLAALARIAKQIDHLTLAICDLANGFDKS